MMTREKGIDIISCEEAEQTGRVSHRTPAFQTSQSPIEVSGKLSLTYGFQTHG